MDLIKQYVPNWSSGYVSLNKEEVPGNTTSTKHGFLSKSCFGMFCFLLGGLAGILVLPSFRPGPSLLLTTPGVPEYVTGSMTKAPWKLDDRFAMERHDNESAAAWETLDSRFIWVDDPIQKGLQPSYPLDADRQIYSIAAFHQLHCTYVIYFGWNSLIEKGPSVLDDEFPGSRGEYTIGGHFSHCVEIIRQALMCYADATLEPLLEMDGQTISKIGLASGWGTMHQCRNFNALVDWVDAQENL